MTSPDTDARPTAGWTVDDWRGAALRDAAWGERLSALAHDVAARGDVAWIHVLTPAEVAAQVAAMQARRAQVGDDALPLLGVPFAIKDNIDHAGSPTTAGCPAFAHRPAESAVVVQRLIDAGAVLIGKTNLDQFATGLVGTRSPYGAVGNAFDPAYVSGGSSSGSASVVARGLVPFALGTDTAGSGRVPAGLNNLVGLKPTRGLFSTRGVLPACRTLDCVSIFALTIGDAQAVSSVLAAYDAGDAYSRRAPVRPPAPVATDFTGVRVGVPDTLPFYGDAASERAFDDCLARLTAAGATLVRFDASLLHEVTALLYDGPWVAERHAVVADLMERSPEVLDPVVRTVISQAARFTATDAFRGLYRLAELSRAAQATWDGIDVIAVPTAPTHYTIEAVKADPVTLNSRLGIWTNFVNLLDWSALAVPASFRADGLPFGLTFIGPAWHDAELAEYGRRWVALSPQALGATGRQLPAPALPAAPAQAPVGCVRVAVVGAHLRGMPLNHQLTTRDARFVREARTASCYRLYALAGTVPPKPGLARADGGASIALELWDVPLARFGEFVAEIPPPLGIGSLELDDGSWVKGFVCEPFALPDATDITHFGGWRAYRASVTAAAPR